MVNPKVIEQGHNFLTEDCSLDGLVAGVHRVLPEAMIRVKLSFLHLNDLLDACLGDLRY